MTAFYLNHWCTVYSAICMLSKKVLWENVTVNEFLAQLFDSESAMEENVSETEYCVEEDLGFEEFSSDETEC